LLYCLISPVKCRAVASTTQLRSVVFSLFFFMPTSPTATYTLSLHDALPIYEGHVVARSQLEQPASFGDRARGFSPVLKERDAALDRKSTRLNSSHQIISYAVFCLKKKKAKQAQKKVESVAKLNTGHELTEVP